MNAVVRGPNEAADLSLVEQLLFAPCALGLERFTHAQTVAGRTPDFRVIRSGELVAFCEVKSPRDDWLDEQLEAAPSFQLVGGLRDDPTFDRIARHIGKAATQFDAVNGERAVPNILVFVNNADTGHFGDLLKSVTGEFYADDGKRYVTMNHISEGRIAKSKRHIDAYAWIDLASRRLQGFLLKSGASTSSRKSPRTLPADNSR